MPPILELRQFADERSLVTQCGDEEMTAER
jgi:hypothetical protein